MSSRGTGATRVGEGYRLGNGFALNKKLPAGRRTLKRLKPYTSPDTICLLLGNTQVSLALSNEFMATPNLCECVVVNHNVVSCNKKRSLDLQSLQSPLKTYSFYFKIMPQTITIAQNPLTDRDRTIIATIVNQSDYPHDNCDRFVGSESGSSGVVLYTKRRVHLGVGALAIKL